VLSPLTGDGEVELLEQIDVADLKAPWLDSFAVDVSSEFSGFDTVGFYRCLKSGLRFFHPAIVGSESFYEGLQRQISWYYAEDKPEYDFARGFISSKDQVLEVGCGRGTFAEKIAARSYLGLELSSKAQEMAAAKGVRVIIQPIEAHCLQWEQQYDVVCAFQVLEHVAAPAAFVEACIRCLKSGGLLIYSVPNFDSYLAYCTNVALGMPPHHVTCWIESALRYVASRFGMDILAVERERLADIHVGDYAAVLARETFLRRLGFQKQRTLINRSLYFKMLNKLAVRLSRPLAGLLLEDVHLRPIGHSITVVLRKPPT
jgi:2-polyprenyl-3-methyl-5-hydroxy-6-metoxy-1,4-benzoquinol methylase